MKKKREEFSFRELFRHKGFIQFMERTLAFLFVFSVEALIITILVDFTFKPDIPSELYLLFRAPVILLFAAIAFYLLIRHKIYQLMKLKPFIFRNLFILLPINILLFFLFLRFNMFMAANPMLAMSNKLLFSFTWYVLGGGLGLALFFAFFRPSYVFSFINKFKKELGISIIIATVFRFIYSYFSVSWQFFSGIVAKTIFFLLKIFFSNAYISNDVGSPIVRAGGFGARIYAPCSGVEGMTLFIILFVMMMIIEWRCISKPKSLLMLAVGTFGAFLINILRVYLIFLFGVWISPEFALGFFHSNVGWILFALYFVVFEFVTYNWIRIREPEPVKPIKL